MISSPKRFRRRRPGRGNRKTSALHLAPCPRPRMSRDESVDRLLAVGTIQREGWNLDVEMLAVVRLHPIGPGHEAGWGRQRRAAGIFKRLSGLQCRLLADDARALHLLQPPQGIGDPPVARAQLNRFDPGIGDRDRIGPEEIAVVRRRAFREETWRHRDFYFARDGAVHGIIPRPYCRLTEASRNSE